MHNPNVPEVTPSAPNILYLHCHDAGRYIGPYGYAVPTPNLRRFAGRATLFRQAFCGNPTCSPSRACLLTSQTAHQSGMLGLNHLGWSLNEPGRHLAAYLRTQGYHTVLSGVEHELWPHLDAAEQAIYDERLDQRGDPAGGETTGPDKRDLFAASLAAEWLEEHGNDGPFFLACGFIYPHRRYPPAAAHIDPSYLSPPAPLPDTPEIRQDMAAYCTAAEQMDYTCGIVLDALDRAGLRDRTIVVFTTDHGIAFPMMKCNLTDAGLGVALIVDYPGNPARGRAVDAMVQHQDVFPTLCKLAGLPVPAHVQGRSMCELFGTAGATIRDELFAEVNYHAGYEPMRCVRTTRHKLIRYYTADTRVHPVNIDDGPAKRWMMAHGQLDVPRPRVCLYDLALDPNERDNLAEAPECRELLRGLEARLDAWMAETDDPLLKGPIPLVEGGRCWPRESVHPRTGPPIAAPWVPQDDYRLG